MSTTSKLSGKKFGHTRQQSIIGKSMPVSSLLMNFSQPPKSYLETISKDSDNSFDNNASNIDDDQPPTIFHLNDVNNEDNDVVQPKTPPPTPTTEIITDDNNLADMNNIILKLYDSSMKTDEIRIDDDYLTDMTDLNDIDVGKKKLGYGNLSVAEAVAQTSAMTSPAARRRLAARKIEMEMNAKVADTIIRKEGETGDYVPPKQLLIYLVRYNRKIK